MMDFLKDMIMNFLRSTSDLRCRIVRYFSRLIYKPVTLHCIGDSHTMVFENIAHSHCWRNTEFRYCIVQGATATGLANPNSQTQAYPIFHKYLEEVHVADHLLFCLGEVDCGFVIWYRAQKYGESVTILTEQAVQNYTKLTDWCLERGFNNITICSAPLPTILDGQDWGEVANKRKEISATLRERTELTRSFNQYLRSYASSHNIKYLDFEFETLDVEKQVVKDSFRNKNRFDHHLDQKALSDVLIPKLAHHGYR